MSRREEQRNQLSRSNADYGCSTNETNSSPETALLSTPLQPRRPLTPGTAIKTSTCGPAWRRGEAGFFFVLSRTRDSAVGRSEGQGFFQGSFPANKEQFLRGRKRVTTGRETHNIQCATASSRLHFLINPYPPYPLARSETSSGAGNGWTAGNNKHFFYTSVSEAIVTDKPGSGLNCTSYHF